MARQGAAHLEELRCRLGSLATLLGGEHDVAHLEYVSAPREAQRDPRGSSRAPPKAMKHFSSTLASSQSVLRNSTNRDSPSSGAVGALLARQREAEAAWAREKGSLAMAARHERARAQKLEGDLRRSQEQVAFRVGEVKHLRAALQQRDSDLAAAADRLREMELADGGERASAEAVQRAEAERDELRGSLAQMLARLTRSSELLSQTDITVGELRQRLQQAEAERAAAQEAAENAQAAAEEAREAAQRERWKVALLGQMSDLALQQNDAKTASLRQLLESEALLDRGAPADESEQEDEEPNMTAAAAAAAVTAAAGAGFHMGVGPDPHSIEGLLLGSEGSSGSMLGGALAGGACSVLGACNGFSPTACTNSSASQQV